MIRTLIVDDEPPARRILATLLAAHEDVAVVGESGSGSAAVRDIERLRPDLLLLDVQMPQVNGFGVLRQLPPEQMPAVIFVTAFDEYALRAFDVSAIDYLMKPVDPDRLAAALARVAAVLNRGGRQADTLRLIKLLETLNRRDSHIERLVVRTEGRVVLLPVREIDWIEADGKFLRIRAGTVRHHMRERVSHVASLLDPRQFVRISRSVIVNISSIREIRPHFRGEYAMIMTDGTQLTSTRGFREGVQKLIDQQL